MIAGDSSLWPGLEVGEVEFDGGAAFWEAEAGMLEDAIHSAGFAPTEPGTYFIEEFTVNYTTDYYGEVDGTSDLKSWRKATDEDKRRFRWVD